MDLWLIRHAEAEVRRPDGSDERRALTPKGRRRFARETEGLARLGVRFDSVLFSPLLRAQETAELALRLCEGESEAVLELARPPDDALMAILRGVSELRTALVGHEPWLSQLVTRLVVQGSWSTDGPSILHIEKGGVVHLFGEVDDGGMSLVAAYPPEALRKLARR
jgi:phosphohistidine phosphatase